MAVSKYTTVTQILFPRGEWKNVGQFSYTHDPVPVHPAVNRYRILARGCDLPSGVVTWHLPRPGVQPCQYKGYTHDLISIV